MSQGANQLPEQAIAEFQRIYQDQFNKQISLKEASRLANRFLTLFHLTYASDSDPPKRPD